MSPELDRLLCDRYPAIFAKRHLSVKQGLTGFGFSCGDGWFDLIEDLCTKLQAGVDRGDFPQVEAVQVKEKCAELRFYYDPFSEAAGALVEEACKRSRTICEICGQYGAMRELDHWYRTRCDLHAEPGSVVVLDMP